VRTAVEGPVDLPIVVVLLFEDVPQEHQLGLQAVFLPQPDNEPYSVALLPFVETIFNRISRVLDRHNIKSVGLPHIKLSSLLRPVKYHLRLRTPGVYMIPC
jgi:hypothetical protein